ncbi:hypothetical protein JTB14_013529 [Gonioctena quinquepunctata]|nr:hypothetical protein JTB14_013529 [Gonioctena quinquepunctata]
MMTDHCENEENHEDTDSEDEEDYLDEDANLSHFDQEEYRSQDVEIENDLIENMINVLYVRNTDPHLALNVEKYSFFSPHSCVFT